MKKLLLTLTLLFSFVAVHAQTQTGGGTDRAATTTTRGTARKGERARYAIASLPTCNSGSVDVTVNISDGNKGQRTCREVSSGVYKWVDDDPVYRPESFNAKGDGTTTDSTALQALIDAAPNGATILGTPGATYLLSATGLVLNGRSNLTFNGQGATIKLSTLITNTVSSGTGAIRMYNGCSKVKFINWKMDGDGIVSNFIDADGNVNCEISFNEIFKSGNEGQIWSRGGSGNTYEKNNIHDGVSTSAGLRVGHYNASGQVETDVQIINNTITTHTSDGIILIGNGLVQGNTCTVNFSGMILSGAFARAGQKTRIIGNKFTANTGHGLQSDVIPTTPTDYDSFANQVSITDNEMSGNAASGIYALHVVNWNIVNNKIYNNVSAGILLSRFQDVGITSNSIYDTRSGGSRTQLAGIVVIADTASYVQKNARIVNNLVKNNKEIGILVTTTSIYLIDNVKVFDNDVIDNANFGIFVAEATTGAVTNLKVRNNTSTGAATYDIRNTVSTAEFAGNIFSTHLGVIQPFDFTNQRTGAGRSPLYPLDIYKVGSSSGATFASFANSVNGTIATLADTGAWLMRDATTGVSMTFTPDGSIPRMAFANADMFKLGKSGDTANNNYAEFQRVGSSQMDFTVRGNVGVGVHIGAGYSALPARFTARATTEQQRLEYDGSNYASFTVSSGGALAITNTGGLVTTGDTGTATASGGAATLSKQRGVVTSESLTTAAGSAYILTLTNTKITPSSIVTWSIQNGTNTQGTLVQGKATPGSNSVTIEVLNIHASQALNGTIKISFKVEQ